MKKLVIVLLSMTALLAAPTVIAQTLNSVCPSDSAFCQPLIVTVCSTGALNFSNACNSALIGVIL